MSNIAYLISLHKAGRLTDAALDQALRGSEGAAPREEKKTTSAEMKAAPAKKKKKKAPVGKKATPVAVPPPKAEPVKVAAPKKKRINFESAYDRLHREQRERKEAAE